MLAVEEVKSAAELVNQLVAVMRRSDPEYAESHGLAQTSDEEWDAAMADAEDWLEDIGAMLS